MALVGGEQLAGQVAAAVAEAHEPRLMVDAGGDDVQFLLRHAEHLGDLAVAALHPVAQADRLHPAVVVAGPGEHGHRVGVVEQPAPRLRRLPNVAAHVQNHRDAALAVHDAPGRQRVAHALVDPVPQRHVDVGGERLHPAHAHGAEHVASARYGGAAVGGGAQPDPIQPVGADVPLRQPVDHVQVGLADVRQRHLQRSKLRHRKQIAKQLAGKPNTAGPNERYLE